MAERKTFRNIEIKIYEKPGWPLGLEMFIEKHKENVVQPFIVKDDSCLSRS